jgi:hypothetical protein
MAPHSSRARGHGSAPSLFSGIRVADVDHAPRRGALGCYPRTGLPDDHRVSRRGAAADARESRRTLRLGAIAARCVAGRAVAEPRPTEGSEPGRSRVRAAAQAARPRCRESRRGFSPSARADCDHRSQVDLRKLNEGELASLERIIAKAGPTKYSAATRRAPGFCFVRRDARCDPRDSPSRPAVVPDARQAAVIVTGSAESNCGKYRVG